MYSTANSTYVCMITSHLVVALLKWTDFLSRDHVQMQKYGRVGIWCQNNTNAMRVLNKVTGNLLTHQAHHLKFGMKNGSWISI